MPQPTAVARHRPSQRALVVVVSAAWLLIGCLLSAPRSEAFEVLQGRLSCGLPSERVIRSEGEVHRWTFEARQGDRVNIAVVGETNDFVPEFRLIAPDGSPAGSAAIDDLRNLGASGTWGIDVRSRAGNVVTGRYFLQVQWVGPNACGTRIACGVTRDEVIAMRGEHRMFLFEGREGDVLNIAVASTEPGSMLVPVWTLFDPDGEVVDGVRQTDQIRRLEREGLYVLMVEDSTLRGTGRFSLSVQGLSESGSCGVGLVCDGVRIADLGSPAQHDAWTFDASAGEWFHVAAEPLDGTGEFDPDWTALGPRGIAVTRTSNEPGFLQAREAGLHTIVVSDHRGPGVGAYHVSLRRIAGRPGCGLDLIDGEWEEVVPEVPGFPSAFAITIARPTTIELELRVADEESAGWQWSLFNPSAKPSSMQNKAKRASIDLTEPGRHVLLLTPNEGQLPEKPLQLRFVTVEPDAGSETKP